LDSSDIKDIKISESHYNLLILTYSIAHIIGLISVFTFMVLIGKYFHDFAILNWQLFEKQRVMAFYVGMTIGFFPAKYMGAVICVIFVTLVNSALSKK